MSDRHPKWQRVEPGTVIPAGQPIRWELANGDAYESVPEYGRTVTPDMAPHFIDSSWKPPLVLPTEPTWGIAVHSDGTGIWFDKWERSADRLIGTARSGGDLPRDVLNDFIPLTDEQVARLEAAK